MTDKELEVIRRRWEEYTQLPSSAYRAFLFSAHEDMGKLLAEIDRLRKEVFKQ